MNKKILFINSKFVFFGGVERYVFDIAGLLNRYGWDCFGFFEQSSDQKDGFGEPFKDVRFGFDGYGYLDELAKSGVKIAFVHKISSPELFRELKKRFKVITFIHDHDYYCIRRHKYFPITRKNCSLPYNLVWCSACSALVKREPSSPFKIKFVNIKQFASLLNCVKQSDICLVMSDFMRDNLVKNGFSSEKIQKIYSVIKPAASSWNSGNGLLYVGQLIRGKGVDLLIDAFCRLKSDVSLKIIGKGNDEGYIRSLIQSRGLEQKVQMVGWCSEPAQHYQESSIVVVPSRWQEPFGLIGVEAFAHCKPVVGFDVGGIGEWLKDGENGFLLPQRDTQAMAGRIDELLADEGKMRLFGENGLQMVQNLYTETKFIEKFTAITERLDV